MREKYCQSIELLNRALGNEISTSLQYIYFHAHCEDNGYTDLATMFRNAAINEMRHIEEISERILFLNGEIEMNPLYPTRQLKSVTEMLSLACELEQKTIDDYNTWARNVAEAEDHGTHRLFLDFIREEEEHLDRFGIELQNLSEYGRNYLALQVAAGSHSANMHREGDWEE